MKKFKTPEEYINFISSELENANHHNYVCLPEVLYDRIANSEIVHDNCRLDLARMIAEEFYNNI